jgi:type IV pilus assembly protein PilV
MLMKPACHKQSGVFLLEALIGILIFAIGILAMIAMQAKAIAVQSDSQYRIEAAHLADRMLGEIALNVNRAGTNQAAQTTNIQTSLAAFVHQPSGTNCNFSGTASSHASVTAWVTDITTTATTRLPGTSAATQQIQFNPTCIVGTPATTVTCNQIIITICWQSSADAVPRSHTLMSYIN